MYRGAEEEGAAVSVSFNENLLSAFFRAIPLKGAKSRAEYCV